MEETEIPWETVSPDTQYVSPNDVDKVGEKTSTASTTDSQTNNQVEARTNTPTVENAVPDKTKNVKNVQSREGRPNI